MENEDRLAKEIRKVLGHVGGTITAQEAIGRIKVLIEKDERLIWPEFHPPFPPFLKISGKNWRPSQICAN